VADRQLQHSGAQPGAAIVKGPPLGAYELVVNARLDRSGAPDACYGFLPATRAAERGPLLTVERAGDGWALVCRTGAAEQAFALPGFDAAEYQQFRFRKQGGRLRLQWEERVLGEIPAPLEATQVWLYAHRAAAFDMVRVIAISE